MIKIITLLTLFVISITSYAGSPVIWRSPYPTVLGLGGITMSNSDNTTACNAAAAGSLRYNTGNFQWCNGSAWTTFGSSGVTSVATGTGLTGGPITGTGTVSLADTAVTPGAYTSANITVDQQGRLTAAANGSGGASLSGLTAAIAGNTIDNLNFAQLWNWSTLTSGTALKTAAASTTFTGKMLQLESTTSNAGVTGTALDINLTGAAAGAKGINIVNAGTANTANGITIDMQGAGGTKTGLAITNAGTNASARGITVNMSGLATNTGVEITAGGNNGIGELITMNSNVPTVGLHVASNSSDSDAIGVKLSMNTASGTGVSGTTTGGKAFAFSSASAASGGAVYGSLSVSNISYTHLLEVTSNSTSASNASVGVYSLTSGHNASTACFQADITDGATTGTGYVATIGAGTSLAADFGMASTAGNRTAIRLKNTATASNDNGVNIALSANRTTSGLTEIAGVGGIITDITDGAYKGALIFKTANNAVPTEKMRIDNAGHIIYSDGTPTITANCGTSPSVAGNDVVGRITVGTGGTATSCTLTFGAAWTTSPKCNVNNETTITLAAGWTPTTTTLVITSSTPFTAGDKLAYDCFGF